jgi:hypothetical protein
LAFNLVDQRAARIDTQDQTVVDRLSVGMIGIDSADSLMWDEGALRSGHGPAHPAAGRIRRHAWRPPARPCVYAMMAGVAAVAEGQRPGPGAACTAGQLGAAARAVVGNVRTQSERGFGLARGLYEVPAAKTAAVTWPKAAVRHAAWQAMLPADQPFQCFKDDRYAGFHQNLADGGEVVTTESGVVKDHGNFGKGQGGSSGRPPAHGC